MIIERKLVAPSKWTGVILGAAAVLVLSASDANAGHLTRACSIAAARRLPLGTRVTVEGTVSTPSGVFASSFFDMGFAVQDRSAGIYVSLQADPHLVPGDRARVTGVLADSYGLLVLLPDAPDDVERCGHVSPPEPHRQRTATVGESTEGLLVSVKGTVVEGPTSDLPYGYKLFVDDGSGALQIFVNLQTGIDVDALAPGQRVSVTGFSSQFEDHYEIDPRGQDDVVVLRR